MDAVYAVDGSSLCAAVNSLWSQPFARAHSRFTTVADIDRKVAAAGFKYQSLILEIVRSLPFQARRGEASPPGLVGQAVSPTR